MIISPSIMSVPLSNLQNYSFSWRAFFVHSLESKPQFMYVPQILTKKNDCHLPNSQAGTSLPNGQAGQLHIQIPQKACICEHNFSFYLRLKKVFKVVQHWWKSEIWNFGYIALSKGLAKLGNIVAETMFLVMFPRVAKLGNICSGRKICVRAAKMFLTLGITQIQQ